MDTTPFSWVISHLAVLGWPAVFYAVYRVLRFCFLAARVLTVVEQRVLKAEDTIYLMANNHLAHIQEAVEETNKHLSEMNKNLALALVRRGVDVV
jgi:hypothetical protein